MFKKIKNLSIIIVNELYHKVFYSEKIINGLGVVKRPYEVIITKLIWISERKIEKRDKKDEITHNVIWKVNFVSVYVEED